MHAHFISHKFIFSADFDLFLNINVRLSKKNLPNFWNNSYKFLDLHHCNFTVPFTAWSYTDYNHQTYLTLSVFYTIILRSDIFDKDC